MTVLLLMPWRQCSYHIKYMFVGNGVKNEVEKVIPTLRPALQLRLRFISHHFKEEAPNPTWTRDTSDDSVRNVGSGPSEQK